MAYVYILANYHNTSFYIGVINNLIRRVYEHKNNMVEGFSKRYKLHKLVYYEQIENIAYAIEREKQLKQWHHNWKVHLIKKINPELKDLYNEICM